MEAAVEQGNKVGVKSVGCSHGWICINRECPARITDVPKMGARMDTPSHPRRRVWELIIRVTKWLDDHQRAVIAGALATTAIGFPLWFYFSGWYTQWDGVFALICRLARRE